MKMSRLVLFFRTIRFADYNPNQESIIDSIRIKNKWADKRQPIVMSHASAH